jgi:hypothetical protein
MGFKANNVKTLNLCITHEKIQVARTAGAEPEVIANHNNSGVYILVQKIIEETVGRLIGEFPVKRNHEEVINTKAAEDFGFLLQAGEQLEIRAGLSEDYPGVWPESDYEGLGTGFFGKGLNGGKKVLMAAVNPVKDPDGNSRPEKIN